MAAELKREKELQEKKGEMQVTDKFQFLIGQSEVFAHFLAGEWLQFVVQRVEWGMKTVVVSPIGAEMGDIAAVLTSHALQSPPQPTHKDRSPPTPRRKRRAGAEASPTA